jgi:anaerobic selenocysteine-containing dehydrogenase
MQNAEPVPSGIITGSMKKDGKVRTACSYCMNFCGVIAYVENGQIYKVEGDPDNPHSRGHLCAKGLSGFLNAYSPKRVTKPLIRTNPEKGLDVDPKWQEISWERAIDIVATKIKEARERVEKRIGRPLPTNPNYSITTANPWSHWFIVDSFDHWAHYGGVLMAWVQSIDGYIVVMSADTYCGNAVHPQSYLNTATFEVTVDPEYSKYVLLVGAQAGSIIHYDTMNVARHIAENRPGNIKVVAVDPVAGYAASKAEEWVPIRPGTDGAFVLALINLLLNEYRIFDAKYLKDKTNAPYLVGQDGLYVRDPKSKKPLIWDPIDKKAKAFDDKTIKDFELEGVYEVSGKKCKPGFQIVKEQVKTYSPEKTSEITTIPAETIRRIAKELGEAACIGQTINIHGVELPYRPVSVAWYRGLSAHRHGCMAGWAILMLPTILGAVQVPGAIRGHPRGIEYVTEDGLMAVKDIHYGAPYPPRPVTRPRRAEAFELFPVAVYSHAILTGVLNDPAKYGVDPKEFIYPEIMMIYRDNVVKNTYDPVDVIRALKKIPFIWTFNIDMDETATALADIVLPDVQNFEKLGESLYRRINEPGYWYAAKPVTKPPFEPPFDNIVSDSEVLLAMAKKAGFLERVYDTLNDIWHLRGTDVELDPNKKYSYEELMDIRLKQWLGQEKGLEWLMSDEGGLLVWGAKPEEEFPGAFREGRIHLYYEFLVSAKNDLDKMVDELGIHWETEDYQGVPDWRPCASYKNRDADFNLFLTNYKNPVMAHSVGRFNPMTQQLIKKRKHLDTVLMNPITANKLGLKDGDDVTVETAKGKKQNGKIHLTQRIHPEVVASSQHKILKGIDFNKLVSLDEDTLDYMGAAIDACLLVRVRKAEGVSR